MVQVARILRNALLTLLAIGSTIALAADAPAVIKNGTTQPELSISGEAANTPLSLPASQQELWQRLLRLLGEDGGFTPKDRVEAVLGIRFTETRQETDPPTLGVAYKHVFEMETEGLGRFRITLFDDPTHTGLGISWGRTYCLDIPSATQDVFRLGWAGGMRDDVPPWRPVRVGFYLAEEVAFADANNLRPGTKTLSQRLSNLTMWSSYGHKSDCMNSFTSDVWRTPLHKQPIKTIPGK